MNRNTISAREYMNGPLGSLNGVGTSNAPGPGVSGFGTGTAPGSGLLYDQMSYIGPSRHYASAAASAQSIPVPVGMLIPPPPPAPHHFPQQNSHAGPPHGHPTFGGTANHFSGVRAVGSHRPKGPRGMGPGPGSLGNEHLSGASQTPGGPGNLLTQPMGLGPSSGMSQTTHGGPLGGMSGLSQPSVGGFSQVRSSIYAIL